MVRLTWTTRDDAPIATAGARIDRAGENRLIAGDNLVAMRGLIEEGLEGKVDLVYLDPPYMSGVDYAVEEGAKKTHAYRDRWSARDEYLDMLWPRLRILHRLLAPRGTIWVQVDHRADPLVRLMLDEIFGLDRFRNAIAWRRAPPLGRQVQSGQFPRNVDTLIAYAKGESPKFRPLRTRAPIEPGRARLDAATGRHFTLAPRGDYTDESVARLEAEGRIHRTASGKVYVKYFLERDADGTLTKTRAVDSMWDDVAPIRHVALAERTGYPTQKPEKLLQRVIESTSDEGDLVLDPFCGSGTTAVAAWRGKRRFVTIDASPIAIETASARFAKEKIAFVKADAIEDR